MKYFWCALSVILLLITAALINIRYLTHFVDSLSVSLTEVQEYAEKGDPETACLLFQAVRKTFEDHTFYLHVALVHRDIDNIESSFGEIQEYLSLGETGPLFAAANSRLLTQLQLLVESEQLNFKNIL